MARGGTRGVARGGARGVEMGVVCSVITSAGLRVLILSNLPTCAVDTSIWRLSNSSLRE